jgi:hypothetical protein
MLKEGKSLSINLIERREREGRERVFYISLLALRWVDDPYVAPQRSTLK